MYRIKNQQFGFTLIELIVVIAIIGILATLVVSSLFQAKEKANYTAAKAEIHEISRVIIVAGGESGNVLKDITGSINSEGQCPLGTSLKNISSSSSCYQRWISSLGSIVAQTGGLGENVVKISRDPWGSPYLLDENEGEQVGNPCVADTLKTAGTDGIRGTSDDYSIDLPFRSTECI